jgi:hypothetical protein
MKQFLFDEFDIVVCLATIHNYLSAAGWSRKVARRRATVTVALTTMTCHY